MQAPFAAAGYIALALFLILTGFLSVRSLARGGVLRFWQGRAVRFLLPWLVWSAIFMTINGSRGGWSEILPDTLAGLLIGPTIHLWFLPFVILSSPLVILAQRALTSPHRVWLAALASVPVATGMIWAHDHGQWQPPFIQWAFATTPLLYGLLSAMGHHHRASAAPIAFVTLTTALAGFEFGSLIAPYLFGAALLFEAAWRARIMVPLLAPLGALAFGIYLIHPLSMLVWYRFAGAEMPAKTLTAPFFGFAVPAFSPKQLCMTAPLILSLIRRRR